MTLRDVLARMFGEDDPADEMVEAALATPEGKVLADLWEAAIAVGAPDNRGLIHVGRVHLERAVDAIRALGDES